MVNLLEKYRGLNLKSDVRTDSLMEPDDIYETKLALNKTGHYEEPEWGLSEFTDEALFSGIKSFQKENNLKIDGIMKPGGETEEKLNNIMTTKSKEKLQEFNGDYVNKLFAENKQKEVDKNKKMSGREIVEKSLKMTDKFSKPNVMNFSGKNKTSSEGVSSEDSEGFLSGIGEMFSKLGEMIGISDNEKGGNTNLNIDKVSEKLPTITADNIKGGFENIKEGKGVYATLEERTTGKEIAKKFPDLTKSKDTIYREINENAGKDISQFITDKMNKNSDMASKNNLNYYKGDNSFYNKVTDNGDWDYKQKLADKITDNKKIYVRDGEWQNAMNYKDKDGKLHRVVKLKGDNNHVYDHDIFSNIHYGYIGKAHNINDNLLRTGSRINDALKKNFKDSLAVKSKDIAAVNLGISLREHINKTGEKLTPELLNKWIIKNKDKLYSYNID